MPRVTDRYVQRRRAEIVAAARRRFARDGFHATTMEDVTSEAGISSSVIYRWFSGKDELVAVCISEALQGVVEVLEETLLIEPPVPIAEAVRRIIGAVLAQTGEDGQELTAIVVQAWAEAMRDPAVKELLGALYIRLRSGLAELVRRHQRAGTMSPDLDPNAASHHLFALIPGFIVQHLVIGPEDLAAYTAASEQLLSS
ncbi:MAG TPA: TetR/AcrR family transcriptional regulator [Pseudonocardia sp.]|nr:TetR/AcrR family transcriptional regulator [Pseudonocardia sp.]